MGKMSELWQESQHDLQEIAKYEYEMWRISEYERETDAYEAYMKGECPCGGKEVNIVLTDSNTNSSDGRTIFGLRGKRNTRKWVKDNCMLYSTIIKVRNVALVTTPNIVEYTYTTKEDL